MIVKAAGFPDRAGEQVLVQGTGSVKAGDPQMSAAVRDVVGRLERIRGITGIESPLDPARRATTVSEDGRSVAGTSTPRGSAAHAETLVDRPLAAVAAVQASHPRVRVEQFGEVSAAK